MKISIITACKNAENLIGSTVRSVLSQSAVAAGRVSLEYLIIDGGSTDRTLEVIQRVDPANSTLISSEPDSGVYDALAKGFARATGDVVGYLNAGDFLFPSALGTLQDAFEAVPVSWMTGYSTLGNARQQPTRVNLPFRFRRRFFLNGIHGTYLPTLQQESTFWRRNALEDFDWAKFRQLKLAGDFLLWQHLSRKEPPVVLHSLIGAFCAHPNQLSADNSKYVAELMSLCDSPGILDWGIAMLDSILWKSPPGAKRRLGGRGHVTFDTKTNCWKLE